uniref:Synaptic vesicle membrane protein VAT-1 homolog n=1 Tax=Cacopsylla melanoneura TaxID=428564 RepID=A0A8D8Z3M9_9HEMI
MSDKVKSIILTEFGGLDKIKVMDWPINSTNLRTKELEVKVSICGVNFADVYTRLGFLPHLETPRVLGLECVGTVVNVGMEVDQFKIGQRVLCYRWTGGLYRERVIVEEKYCFTVPDSLSDEQLVCLPSQYLTAYFALFDFGNLRPNQTVLMHSCVGGVGCAVTQLCKTVPNVTIHGTTSAHKLEVARLKGVHHVFTLADLNKQNHRYDIIIDPLGGPYSSINQSLLKHLGRSILIGATSMIGSKDPPSSSTGNSVDYLDLVMNNRSISGLHVGLICENAPLRVKACMEHLFTLCMEEKIAPIVHATFTFDQIQNAQEELLERRNIGKILLRPH